MKEQCIKTINLSKKYGKTLALNQVNINVETNDIYGLIGRNGAGKTTLLKILSKQIVQFSGSFEIFDENISKDEQDLRIGSIIESPGLYPSLTAYENLELKCIAMGIRRKNYVEDLLELVELSAVHNRKVKKFSLGMKQRLSLAMALVGEPDILLLDEPTNGMDPQGISEFRQLILSLNRERNITIVISSHILSELSKMVSKIGIIHEGNLLKEISKTDLLEENRDRLILKGNNLNEIIAFLEENLSISNFVVVSDREIEIYDFLDKPEYISHNLIKNGILFDTFEYKENSLEEYYIKLTGGSKNA